MERDRGWLCDGEGKIDWLCHGEREIETGYGIEREG